MASAVAFANSCGNVVTFKGLDIETVAFLLLAFTALQASAYVRGIHEVTACTYNSLFEYIDANLCHEAYRN